MHRRTFLKGTLAGGIVAIAAGSGLLTPTTALAANWPKGAFEAKSIDDTLKNLFGQSERSESADIKIEAPIQAESGLAVPITVSSTLPNVEAIAIMVEKNPSPLAAYMETAGASAYFRTRIKMGQTSPVYAVVKSNGKLFTIKQNIKVTSGGCGG